MNIQLKGNFAHLLDGIKTLQTDYGFKVLETADINLICEQRSDHDGLSIEYHDGEGHITYQKTHHFF